MADLINTLTPAVNYSANELTPTGYLDATLNTVVYAHNYNDLSNKPSINGVTLKGNKTPVQLGLLTAEDIPVTSVNGQTGDVSLSGSNLMYNQNTTINEAIDDVADQIPTVPVRTVNGLTGNVVLTGNNVNYDVGESINHKIDDLAGQIVGSGVSSVNGKTGVVTLNGTDIQYDVNKTINQAIDSVAAQIPTVPVQSVNNKTGSVTLTGDDIDYIEGVSVNDQISANTIAIGDLSDLNTSDKSSLVAAVNEVCNYGGLHNTAQTALDLNDLKTNDTANKAYHINMAYCSNAPTNSGTCLLEVIKPASNGAMVLQRTTNYGSLGQTHIRFYLNSTWTNWIQISQ